MSNDDINLEEQMIPADFDSNVFEAGEDYPKYPNDHALNTSKIVTTFKLTTEHPIPDWIKHKKNISVRKAGNDILLLVDNGSSSLFGYETGKVVYEDEDGMISEFNGFNYTESLRNDGTGEVTYQLKKGNVSAHKVVDVNLPEWLSKDYVATEINDEIVLKDKKTDEQIIAIPKGDYLVFSKGKLSSIKELNFFSTYYKVNDDN